MTTPTPRTEHDELCERIDVDIGVGTMHSPCECNLRKAQRDLAAAKEALAAKNAALDFAEGAIEDAIYSEDGLEGDTGQRVIAIIQEARDKGTFDKEKFGDPPKTRIELASDLAAARECIRKLNELYNDSTDRVERAEAQAEKNARDAEKWQLMFGSARVSPVGSAGLNDKGESNYAHLCLNFWTIHDPATGIDPLAQEWIDGYLAKARAAIAGEKPCK